MGARADGRAGGGRTTLGVRASRFLAAARYAARQDFAQRAVGRGSGTLEEVGMNLWWWSGKRVFVTGHTGFKGSWCCLWLQRLGAIVTGYALVPESQPNLFESGAVAQGM